MTEVAAAGDKALQGIKVLTFEHALAGPMTSSIMGAYGAEVIRVESMSHLDWHRQAGPFVGNLSLPNRSACYLFVNSGKRGISLNLQRPQGIDLAKRLVKWADVVIENFAGGVMNKMGLGYDELRRINPGIIMLSAGIYGQTGPYARVKGHGGPLTALTGLPQITGFPGQEPQFPGFAITDFTAPRAAVLAIVAALDYRRRTGFGQFLDAAQFESAVHLLTPVVLDYAVNKRELRGIGNRCDHAAPHGVYRCQDERWCAVTVFGDEQWEKFVGVIGNPPWTKTYDFATLAKRLEDQDRLDLLVEQWTLTLPAAEVMNRLQGAGISAGVVQGGRELDSDPQLRHRGFYRKLDHPEDIGAFTYSGMSPQMSKTPYEIKRAPMLGEDNEYVYTEILGMSDEQFVKLLDDGLFE